MSVNILQMKESVTPKFLSIISIDFTWELVNIMQQLNWFTVPQSREEELAK